MNCAVLGAYKKRVENKKQYDLYINYLNKMSDYSKLYEYLILIDD